VSGNQRPAPPPLEANDQLVTAVITAAWAVALVVMLVVRGQLPASGQWWVWTCLAGLCMGLFGLWYVPRTKRARARRAQRRAEQRAQAAAQPCSSDSKTVSSTETPGTSTRS
jgi:type VI protein secretion system component VasK